MMRVELITIVSRKETSLVFVPEIQPVQLYPCNNEEEI